MHKEDHDKEIDLNKWMERLKELRKMLEKPLTANIIDDDQTQPIRLIRLKESQTTDGAVRLSEAAPTVTRSSK